MAKGMKTGGRQKGTPNRMTVAAKEAFQLAFDQMGGPIGLATWVTENPTEFYKLYSKLIPVDTNVTADVAYHIATGVPRGLADN